MESDRRKALEKRLEELKLEVARKNALLASTNTEHHPKPVEPSDVKAIIAPTIVRSEAAVSEPCNFDARQELLDVLERLAQTVKDSQVAPRPQGTISGESEGEYEALRGIAVGFSHNLEQEARKIVLGWKVTEKDVEGRTSLLQCIGRPFEGIVTALNGAALSSSVADVLRATCLQRAAEVCSACKGFLEGINTKNAAPLAGAIEAVCESIRMLPVSNQAAAKRQFFEAAKTLSDSQREFESIKESGTVDWDMPDDEDDKDDENGSEDVIDEADAARLDLACKMLGLAKAYILMCGNSLSNDVSSLNSATNALIAVVSSTTDFGVELYPPQESARLTQKATLMRNSFIELFKVLGKPDACKQSLQTLEETLARIVA